MDWLRALAEQERQRGAAGLGLGVLVAELRGAQHLAARIGLLEDPVLEDGPRRVVERIVGDRGEQRRVLGEDRLRRARLRRFLLAERVELVALPHQLRDAPIALADRGGGRAARGDLRRQRRVLRALRVHDLGAARLDPRELPLAPVHEHEARVRRQIPGLRDEARALGLGAVARGGLVGDERVAAAPTLLDLALVLGARRGFVDARERLRLSLGADPSQTRTTRVPSRSMR